MCSDDEIIEGLIFCAKNSHTHNRAWLAETRLPSLATDVYPLARGISANLNLCFVFIIA
jgi:hypothetical protein